MKTAIVCGAGGFIGGHLVKRLKQDDFWVRGVDQKHPEFAPDEWSLPICAMPPAAAVYSDRIEGRSA